METTQVIIVGGGPSGLVLGLSLARHGIRSIILEKAAEPATDPRGVWLTGDAVRIMHTLDLGDDVGEIGQEVPYINFHHSTFNTVPFFRMPISSSNSMEQSVSEGLLQSQPKLEFALRRAIEKTTYCTLRTNCEVTDRLSELPPKVRYTDEQGAQQEILGQWLVGADGKMGVVRKRFLEPTAGIQQQAGLYPYEGVWIASNFKLTVPTPESHPDLPLWELGYTPEEVYDLFWPRGWHFCSPPGNPTATGRFGPRDDRTWRHEFRVDESKGPIYSEELMWAHLTPSITLKKDMTRGITFDSPVMYPRDCIQILRCRPFKFVHKCVNRWYDRRTLLIGDAAHVFPPFAGQGIASGMRDAHQLSWRLALLLNGCDPMIQKSILESWALERRRSVDDAAMMSKTSGFVCNNEPKLWMIVIAKFLGFFEGKPCLERHNMIGVKERSAFHNVRGGFFLEAYNGGARLAQIYVRSSQSHKTILSDTLLRLSGTIFSLIVICDGDVDQRSRSFIQAKAAIQAAELKPHALSEYSIVLYDPSEVISTETGSSLEVYSPVPTSEIRETLAHGYNSESYFSRIGRSTKFVIARPDLFTFACARSVDELATYLIGLKKLID